MFHLGKSNFTWARSLSICLSSRRLNCPGTGLIYWGTLGTLLIGERGNIGRRRIRMLRQMGKRQVIRPLLMAPFSLSFYFYYIATSITDDPSFIIVLFLLYSSILHGWPLFHYHFVSSISTHPLQMSLESTCYLPFIAYFQ